jgi:TatD DNase family protein
LIDIGVNLTNKRFDKDRLEVIFRAKDSNINQLLITGTNVRESTQAVLLCQQYHEQFPDTLYSTAGIHPHDADQASNNFIEQLTDLAKNPFVKAIGECGLDFNRNFSSPERQVDIFSKQIALAAQLNMPLFLHQRDAFTPWFEQLKPYFDRIPSMISHCFTGNKEELLQCIDAGMYIGITGWLCDERRGQELQEIVKYIPLDKLLIETDAPYLTPRNIRPRPKSSRNEPSYLPYVVNKLAEIIGVDQKEIACQTSINAHKAFNLNMANHND